MNAIPADTTIEAARKQFEILRNMTGEQRLQMAFELSNARRNAIVTGVKQIHPEYDDKAVKREVLRLMIGDKLFNQMMKNIGDRL